MSKIEIKDGLGSGLSAKVDQANRLHTHTVSESIGQNASREGLAYNVNTGNISLTSANESTLLYIKNTEDFDIHIAAVGFLMGNSTGGSGDVTIAINKNVTAGTIISGALTPAINTNKNAGSNLDLDATVYKGAEAATNTGGVAFYTSLIAGAARPYVISTGDIVLPRNASMAVALTPPAGNTAMNVQVFLAINVYNLD